VKVVKALIIPFQIIWFTALFPYFVMFILLARALTLEGAIDGLAHYIHIDWSKLQGSML
jgi:solute carrier family 6 GABA transporter-like protein 1